MTFTVATLPEAEADFQTLYSYIAERSVQGANAWANAFNEAFEKLKTNPHIYSLAPESSDVDDDVYQLIFKTRRGNPYRLLFSIRDTNVFIWAVRGFHQDDAIDLTNKHDRRSSCWTRERLRRAVLLKEGLRASAKISSPIQ